MALIAIEGVDGGGKSTLAEELAIELGRRGERAVELHFGPPVYDHSSTKSYGEQAIAELEEPLRGYVPGSGISLVMDRAHWGCPSYGPVFRPSLDQRQGFGELTAGEFWKFHDWLNRMGALQIYVHVDVALAVSRTGAARDQLLTDDQERRTTQLYQVQRNYAELMSRIIVRGGPPVEWIHLTDEDSSQRVAPRLVDKALQRDRDARATLQMETQL
jgi:hypothetical protein